MLCAKNSDVAERALTKLALGSRKLYEEFNLDAFLEQYEEGKEGIGKYMEVVRDATRGCRSACSRCASSRESELYQQGRRRSATAA